jgi:hypothetical protein
VSEVVIRVRHVPSGEVRTHSWTEREQSLCDFIWTEGNYACDCNRGLFFLRAENPDLGPDCAIACGRGLYALDSVDVDGIRIIENDEATPASSCD